MYTSMNIDILTYSHLTTTTIKIQIVYHPLNSLMSIYVWSTITPKAPGESYIFLMPIILPSHNVTTESSDIMNLSFKFGLSLSMMYWDSSKQLHVSIIIFFLWYFIVWIHQNLSSWRTFWFLKFGVIMNKATVNCHPHVFV